MQLEINILRKHMGTLKKPDVANHKTVPLTSSAMVKLNIEKSSCGCKGNCSSRICGCVRKNIKCNLSCKCGDKACQNQVIILTKRIFNFLSSCLKCSCIILCEFIIYLYIVI